MKDFENVLKKELTVVEERLEKRLEKTLEEKINKIDERVDKSELKIFNHENRTIVLEENLNSKV